jgi:hypothetical protein
MPLSAPKLATHLQATLRLHDPRLIVLGIRHRAKGRKPAVTVLEVTTPDQREHIAPAIEYWHHIKTACHLRDYALWDSYQPQHPTRNHTSVLMLVEGQRIGVEWESTLQYVDIKRVLEQPKIITLSTIPPSRALMCVAA